MKVLAKFQKRKLVYNSKLLLTKSRFLVNYYGKEQMFFKEHLYSYYII